MLTSDELDELSRKLYEIWEPRENWYKTPADIRIKFINMASKAENFCMVRAREKIK